VAKGEHDSTVFNCRWISHKEIRDAAVDINSFQELVRVLQGIPASRLRGLQKNGALAQGSFQYEQVNRNTYSRRFFDQQSSIAPDLIISHLCNRAANFSQQE